MLRPNLAKITEESHSERGEETAFSSMRANE